VQRKNGIPEEAHAPLTLHVRQGPYSTYAELGWLYDLTLQGVFVALLRVLLLM